MAEMVKVVVVGGPKGTMSGALIERLEKEGLKVVCSLTGRYVWVGNDQVKGYISRAETEEEIAVHLAPYIEGVKVAFIAIPTSGKGEIELAYMRYFLSRGIYVVTFAKGALAYHYAELKPHLHMIGRYATVGGRTLILPWLNLQRMRGKTYTMWAYLNASVAHFMTEVGNNGYSAEDAFSSTRDNHLAEPGAKDYVSFVNTEIGLDMVLKCCIVMNDALLPLDGPFMTPEAFDAYVPLDREDIRGACAPDRTAALRALLLELAPREAHVRARQTGDAVRRVRRSHDLGRFLRP
jgi:homoserine dehydrogenase